MPACLKHKKCLRNFVYWPGIFEAGLHCLYTGFFVIEAATYGLILEQKFHGVLQILLINFYLVLLCLVFIRWNLDLDSVVCHLLISILSFVLSVFVGKLILLYIDYMERPRVVSRTPVFRPVDSADSANQNMSAKLPSNQDENDLLESFPKKVSVNAIMKLDPLIVILDISVYLLISISYIIMLLKISFKLRKNTRSGDNSSDSSSSTSSLRGHDSNNSVPSFYEITSSDGSIISTIGNAPSIRNMP